MQGTAQSKIKIMRAGVVVADSPAAIGQAMAAGDEHLIENYTLLLRKLQHFTVDSFQILSSIC